MNKKEFITKIIKGFPSSFAKMSSDDVFERYNVAIEENLDFDKLFELFCKNWGYKTAPRPAYFQQFFSQCRNPFTLINMPSERRKALIKVALWVDSPEYIKCLYEHKKAPPHIRELYRKYQFEPDEIDQLRVSGQIEKGETEWN